MKKAIVAILAALVLCGQVLAADCTWAAVSGYSRSVTATGAANCTFTVATAAATAGMWLDSVRSFSIEICAAAGQTITTAFALNAYAYSPHSGLWSAAKGWNIAANGDTGNRCTVIAAFEVPGPKGRIAFAPSAGAVSSGNITITLTAVEIGRYEGNTLL